VDLDAATLDAATTEATIEAISQASDAGEA
jgi:hypothetical protein